MLSYSATDCLERFVSEKTYHPIFMKFRIQPTVSKSMSREPTVIAVSSLSDPLCVLADEMPRVRRKVACDGRFVVDTSHLSVLWRLRVSTAGRCNSTQLLWQLSPWQRHAALHSAVNNNYRPKCTNHSLSNQRLKWPANYRPSNFKHQKMRSYISTRWIDPVFCS